MERRRIWSPGAENPAAARGPSPRLQNRPPVPSPERLAGCRGRFCSEPQPGIVRSLWTAPLRVSAPDPRRSGDSGGNPVQETRRHSSPGRTQPDSHRAFLGSPLQR